MLKNDHELVRTLPYPTDADQDTRNKIDKKRASLKSKVSSKGLSKRTNKLTDAQFKHVLMTKSSVHGTNTDLFERTIKHILTQSEGEVFATSMANVWLMTTGFRHHICRFSSSPISKR